MTATKHSLEEPNHPERTSSNPPPKKRLNAFTELMSTKKFTNPPAPTAESPSFSAIQKTKSLFNGLDPRNGLGIYIDTPETNPEGRIVSYDDDFVVIRDKFPKASVHLLLIPRNKKYFFEHPLKVLSQDAGLREVVVTRVEGVKKLAAQELRRLYGPLSVSDQPYQSALEDLMSGPDTPTEAQLDDLPPGRDWSREIVAGVHTHPSMNHLHIHILSRDMHSECMKHKKHYLSFTTSFLVQMEDFPLEKGSLRFKPGDWPNWEMKCWRCGEGYGNKFKKLKGHLEDEFGEWVKE